MNKNSQLRGLIWNELGNSHISVCKQEGEGTERGMGEEAAMVGSIFLQYFKLFIAFGKKWDSPKKLSILLT